MLYSFLISLSTGFKKEHNHRETKMLEMSNGMRRTVTLS